MFTPYVTAGIGYNKLKKSEISLTGNTKDKSHLAWNAGLGLKTKIDHNIDLDLGYKFVNLGKIKNPIKNVKVQANEITAGVIVSF
jgi:opacity protein-like surface antigen